MFDFIAIPLGYIMEFLYKFTNNYGLVLILLTLFVRICLLPLGIKQQKSMAATQRIQPKLQAIQQKYKNDREKLNEETMKLYQEEGVSPMAGCLPLLIQLPILFGLIQVIYHPIKYMATRFPEGVAAIAEKYPDIAGGNSAYSEIALANATGRINFNFLGLDLTKIPSVDKANVLVWILPVLATVATYFSGKISQNMSASNNSNQNNPAAGSMKMMTWMMPLMTIFFAYNMPNGAALYWLVSTALSVVQSIVLMKLFHENKGEPVPAAIIDEKPTKVKKEKNPNPYKNKNKKWGLGKK